MIVRMESTENIKKLFANWQKAILWSCLQNVMGTIYVDHLKAPQSAMAILGDFCFLAGRPDKELVLYRPEGSRQEFLIMIPQNVGWAKMIEQGYGSRAKAVTRYAMKKEEGNFDRNRLKDAVKSLKSGYVMKMIDEEIFNLCRSMDWSRDLISQFRNYEMYRDLGIGAVVMKDGALISGASSYARYRKGIEIEIDTKQDDRRCGFAYACGAKLILECLERGLYPSWDAQNKDSVALAEKLGYEYSHDYVAYEIWGY